MKGQVDLGIQEAVLGATALFLVSGLLLFGLSGLDFLKTQNVGLEAERVVNAGIAMESIPQGHAKLELKGYKFDYNEGKVNISIRGAYAEANIEEATNYQEIIYTGDREKVDNFICLVKEKKGDGLTLEFRVDSC